MEEWFKSLELSDWQRKAIRVANRRGSAIHTHGEGHIQMAARLPLILKVRSQRVILLRHIVDRGKGLRERASTGVAALLLEIDAIVEVRQAIFHDFTARIDPGGQIAEIDAAEIDAEFNPVIALRDGKIVHYLVPANPAALRIVEKFMTGYSTAHSGERRAIVKQDRRRENGQSGRNVRRSKNGAIVNARNDKLVHHGAV